MGIHQSFLRQIESYFQGQMLQHFVLLVDTAINLPSSFVGASAMLHVEPFLKENVVVWSILLPLKTIDTQFSDLRIKSRSEHLSLIVSKKDW